MSEQQSIKARVVKAVTSRRNGRLKLSELTNNNLNRKGTPKDYRAPFLFPTFEDVNWNV